MTDAELSPLDREFASYLQRAWLATGDLARFGAQVSAALREGHSGLPPPPELDLAGPCLGPPGSRCPLILDQGLVSLHRLWSLEDRLARALLARSQPRTTDLAPATMALADALFSQPGPQLRGALLPFGGGLSIITGGPGTGKTWVLGRLLALQMAQRGSLPRVALAAPTGKAAQRMAEALRDSATTLPPDVSSALMNLVPQTLHRLLLGTASLPYDLVVVDEASMIDLHLADRLLSALAPETDLVLLGDPDQLPSVDAGRVLADVVEVLTSAEPSPVVRLTESRRFVAGQAVGVVANAILSQSLASAQTVLNGPGEDRSSFRLVAGLSREELISRLSAEFEGFWNSSSPAHALENLSRFLVLAAINEGPWGQVGLNRALDERAPSGAPRPIMILENDSRSGLANGDLGVIWHRDGQQMAWFGEQGSLSSHVVAVLPPFQSAYAITIHKSQGSEFERLAIVLPESSSLTLSRELLYTAVTRARRHGVIYGTHAQLESAVATATLRHSGLASRLRAWQNPAP